MCISFAEKFKCAHRVDVKFAHLLWYVRTKENVDKGSGAMSDAPATNDAAPMDDAFAKVVQLDQYFPSAQQPSRT